MAAKYTGKEFKKITLDDMCDFIEKHAPEDKAWFKKVAYQDKNGNDLFYTTKDAEEIPKYNHLNAVREFCKKYNPDLIPVAKEKKEPATKRLADW